MKVFSHKFILISFTIQESLNKSIYRFELQVYFLDRTPYAIELTFKNRNKYNTNKFL
jgi:hypothetical protein